MILAKALAHLNGARVAGSSNRLNNGDTTMNLTEHFVTEVKSEPYFKYGWCVDVLADSWGNVQPTTVICTTEDEAKNVKPGYKFEA